MVEQQDRSLTVMIPRAKYHPSLKQGDFLDSEGYKSKSASSNSVNINQTKLLNYLDASPSTTKLNKVCIYLGFWLTVLNSISFFVSPRCHVKNPHKNKPEH
jgi:hypothetical protein